MSSVHAREYTPAELNTRLAEYLLHNYGVNADVTWLLDYHEFHLMLQANPDGRKQAEAGYLWRKNVNENYCSPTSSYRGADLNRNFSFYWNSCSPSLGCSSGYQCDITYRGPGAASEPETQAIQDYVRSIFPDQRQDPIDAAAPLTATGVFMDMHSYSELVLWPWGFTYAPAPNDIALQTLGRKLAYFNGYAPSSASGLYPTDGNTDDFAYGELGLAAYTYELGTAFFQDCAAFENEILPDNLPSLIYLGKAARAPYQLPAGPDPLRVTAVPAIVESGESFTVTVTLDDTRFNNENGVEPIQSIAAAEYYLDTPPWMTTTTPLPLPLTAADGAFDSAVETAQGVVDTTGLPEGRHILYARGRDAAGNWGVVGAAFFQVTEPEPPAASFLAPSSLRVGETAVFTNTSTGSALTFHWDAGDGSPPGDSVHYTHVYTAAGTYTVTLTAVNPAGEDRATTAVTVLPLSNGDETLYLPWVARPD
jgi:hypothetical protein